MTEYVHRCMIITAPVAPFARLVTSAFNEASQGMFTTPLQPLAGSVEPTHFISVGMIGQEFADLLASPEALVAGAAALGVDVPLEQAHILLGAADVSDEQADEAMARLGLKRFETTEGV